MSKRYWAQGLRRDKQLQVRLSAEEYKQVQASAKEARLPLVGYARNRILGLPIRKAKPQKTRPVPAASSI